MKEKKVVSWEEIKTITEKLGDIIKNSNKEISYISGIPRGGAIPAIILSHYLNIPYKTYDSILMEINIDSSKILLIDDISDSGKTLKGNSHYITATLFLRYNSEFIPDFYYEEIKNDNWIVFPWESLNSKPIQGYLDKN